MIAESTPPLPPPPDELMPHRVVRASAGTGKTYALTTRFVWCLRRGASPEAVLASTFTRKAAGEILGRVLYRLADAATDEQKAAALSNDLEDAALRRPHYRVMLRMLGRSLHRLNISTLDAFFYRIARSYRFELGFGPGTQVVDDADPLAAAMQEQALHAILGHADASDDMQSLLEMLRRLHHDSTQRSIIESLRRILTGDGSTLLSLYREAPDRRRWQQLKAEGLLDRKQVAERVERMRQLGDQLPITKKGSPHSGFAKAWARTLEQATQRRWEAFATDSFCQRFLSNEPKFSGCEIADCWREVYDPLIAHASAELIRAVAAQTEATFDLIHRFETEYAALRRRNNVLLYSDLPLLLDGLSIGGEVSLEDIYFRLDGQVAHLLLDEFQDTSLQQWEVVRPLAEEICSYGDASRSFFCVGDMKQAIYGWRGGCPELLGDLPRQLGLPGDAVESANKSYRCSPIVLDVVNRVFSHLVGLPPLSEKFGAAAPRWQSMFEEHTAAFGDRPGHVTFETTTRQPEPEPKLTLEEEDDEGEVTGVRPTGPISHHLREVGQRIEQLAEAHPDRSIGVLMRSNKKASQLISVLRQAGVDASGEGGASLIDDAAVNVVLSAMRLADHPGDRISAFHVLHSPLAAVIGLDHDNAATRDRVARAIRMRLLHEGYAGLVAEWTRAIHRQCSPRNLTRLTQLVQVAEAYRVHAPLRPTLFAEHVEKVRVEESAPSRVRIMTIHGSKGLQFDLVVLPELDGELVRSHGTLAMTKRDEPTGPIEAVYRMPRQAVRALSPQLEEAYNQWECSRFDDAMCALYVAMTRAKHAVHMLVEPLSPTSKGEIGKRGYMTPSWSAVLRHALLDSPGEEEQAGGVMLFEHGDPDWAQRAESEDRNAVPPPERTPRVRLASGSKADRNFALVAPSALHGGATVRGADLLTVTPHEGATHGSVIHGLFEQIRWSDDDAPSQPELIGIARQHAPDAGDDWLNQRVDQFLNMLGEPIIQQTLARPVGDKATLWRERTFAVALDDRIVRGTFDRVVVQRDNSGEIEHVHLIDFKTDRVDDDRASLGELIDHYRPQMQAYRESLRQMLGISEEKIDVTLLFVGVPEAVSL